MAELRGDARPNTRKSEAAQDRKESIESGKGMFGNPREGSYKKLPPNPCKFCQGMNSECPKHPKYDKNENRLTARMDHLRAIEHSIDKVATEIAQAFRLTSIRTTESARAIALQWHTYPHRILVCLELHSLYIKLYRPL